MNIGGPLRPIIVEALDEPTARAEAEPQQP